MGRNKKQQLKQEKALAETQKHHSKQEKKRAKIKKRRGSVQTADGKVLSECDSSSDDEERARRHFALLQDKSAPAGTTASSTSTALYKPGDMILLVGEGDLSFSVALLQKLRSQAYVVGTVLDRRKEVAKKYPDTARHNISVLTASDMAEVRFEVDATDIPDDFKNKFTKVVFNFPHIGQEGAMKGMRGEREAVEAHCQLLQGFFESAMTCLDQEDELSEIHVTLKKGQPYDSWRISALAKQAGLQCHRSVDFKTGEYAGYAHKRTLGDKYEEGRGFNPENMTNNARVHVFRRKRAGA